MEHPVSLRDSSPFGPELAMPTTKTSCYGKQFLSSDLEQYIDQDGDEGVGEIEEEPHLNRLDIRGGGQTCGDREVDGGQDHHAGDVDGVDYAELVVTAYHLDVVCG